MFVSDPLHARENTLNSLLIFSWSMWILWVFFCFFCLLPALCYHLWFAGKRSWLVSFSPPGFSVLQPIRCLLHRPAEWSTCTVTTALRRAPAASSLTAPWRRHSSVSMDTAMLSSSSSLYPVGTKPTKSVCWCNWLHPWVLNVDF